MDDRKQTEETQTYQSAEEYFCELTEWAKEWIVGFCKKAVTITPEGELLRIRGRLLFAQEMHELCEPQFTKKELLEYKRQNQRLLARMQSIHERSGTFIAKGEMITMEYVYRIFGFSEFEWYLFVMAFAVELEPQFERVFGLLQDDLSQKAPSLELCIRMFTLSREERFLLQRKAVERWEFLSGFFGGFQEKESLSGNRDSILSVPLKLDTGLIRFLYDMASEDPMLKGAVRLYLPGQDLEPMVIRSKLVKKLTTLYQSAGTDEFLLLSGAKGIGKKFLVRHFCSQIKQPLLLVDFQKLPLSEVRPEQLARRIFREAVLKGNAVLCFHGVSFQQEELGGGADLDQFFSLIRSLPLLTILTSAEQWNSATETHGMRCLELALADTNMEEREMLWNHWLGEVRQDDGVSTERLADRYQLTPGAIRKALHEAENQRLVQTADNGKKELQRILYSACQRQLVHKLGKDAVKIRTQYTMEDLILPAPQKRMLRDVCNLVEYHHQVYDKWGFDQKVAYGKGVSMIFYGPPGTGKTMGAQAIAGELNLELYRVDMAGILSKYIGESEKKLGNIFEQGAKSQSILFFDEADALFGKRSEVKDAQDKYANASTAYLLQKIEEYEGTIILATNLLQNFDAAFCRRFQFIIEFPFPDVARREEIWSKVFPKQLPLEEELDIAYLAEEFVFSGSQIKNIAVAAAFLAAGEGGILGMRHILMALKREMKKAGKNMIASDFGKYYSLMEEKGVG